jgi:lipid A 3-O-deacylase
VLNCSLGFGGKSKRMSLRVLIVVLVAAVVLLDPVLPAFADGFVQELKIGVLDHDVPNLWSGFRAEPDSADINIEAIFSPSVAFLGGTISPALGGSISTIGATSDVYLDARWQMEMGCGIFLGLGIGGAVHNGQLQLEDWDRKALGSRVLFHIPLEIGYRLDDHNSLSAYFEHMSNAYTVSPNEGLDRLGIRYGYRF